MLYKCRTQRHDLCVLTVSPDILDLDNVVVTDSNASSDYVRFAKAPEGLRIVDRALVFAEYWTHADPIEQFRHKAAKCAEVLVLDCVAPEFIRGAFVVNEQAQERLALVAAELPAAVDAHFFFATGNP